jgi:hypothetical protein
MELEGIVGVFIRLELAASYVIVAKAVSFCPLVSTIPD